MAGMEITTNIGCRVQCTFCPQTNLMTKYEENNEISGITFGNPELMGLEVFKICIDKLPKDTEIHFAGYSEPFLDPECSEMIVYAHSRGHKISVYSTLVGLNVKDVEKFKHIPFQSFVIHLPDQEKYAKIAISQQYLEVLKELISSKIRHLSCMSMGTLPQVIIDAIGYDFSSANMNDRAGNSEFGSQSGKKTGPIICNKFNKNGVNTLDQNVLLPNGDVTLCCMDYSMKHIIGNLKNSDYKSLFGIKFQKILQSLDDKDSDVLCRICMASTKANDYVPKIKKYMIPNQNDSEDSKRIKDMFEEILYRYPVEIELEHLLRKLSKNKTTLNEIKNKLITCEERKHKHPLPYQL